MYWFDSCDCSWGMGTKFSSVYSVQHNSSLLGQSLTKVSLANTLEACFSMPKEMKLALIDDSLKGSCRLWAEWNVVLLSKSSASMPHLTFSPFSSMESLPGKFMMWCKVLVFQQCLHPWNWIVCSVAHTENSIHAFLHSRERWRGSSPHSSRVWWLSLTKTFMALITIWLRLVFDFLLSTLNNSETYQKFLKPRTRTTINSLYFNCIYVLRILYFSVI